MLLEILSWVSFIFLALFATLCLAAGLLYLAELVEEYTVATKAILQKLIVGIIAITGIIGVFTPIDVFPSTIVGVAAHFAYYALLHDFPYFNFTSIEFVLSCGLVILHHWAVFNHFGNNWYPFDQVIAYFVLCVWIVPFTLFISLSANENVLPTSSGLSAPQEARDGGPKRTGGLLGVLTYFKSKLDDMLPRSGSKTF